MTPLETTDSEEVGVLAPTGRDAPLLIDVLQRAGFGCRVLRDAQQLVALLPDQLGAALVTEEALSNGSLEAVKTALATQPAWSDFPIVVLVAQGVEPVERALKPLVALGNISLLDRPLRVRTVVSAVSAALRARRRQYDVRHAILQRDRFLAMLGHELRNPLGAIVFATERMEQSPSAAQRHLDTVKRQAHHMTRLVDDLLDVSRVTSGKIALDMKVLDVYGLLKRVIDTVEPAVRAQQITVTLHPCGQPVHVLGDVVRLEQVFGNLLTNALKYTPSGGRVDLRVEASQAEVVVRVKDTGIGLEPRMLNRIFEPFAQIESTLDRARGGMGLGLTLARSLVEQHGGHVLALSEGLGRGSELFVQLPRVHGDLAPLTAAKSQGDVAPMHLALVEDNADIRDTLKELLEGDGHRVDAAADGREGLKVIAEGHPQLAFVDIGLPGLDGYQLAEAVRQQLGASVYLVAMSGYGQPEDRARALKAGFDAHLTKPVDTDGLKQAMLKAQRPRP